MLKTQFKCRKATNKDAGQIVKVMQNTTYVQYKFPGKSFSEVKKTIIDNMRARTYLVCVDSSKDKIVGYFILDEFKDHWKERPTHLKINKKYAFHAGVGIHSNYRGMGLATKLTKYAFNVAKKRGFPGMYCDVNSTNDTSLRLQERCGFREIARYTCSFRPKGAKNVVFKITF